MKNRSKHHRYNRKKRRIWKAGCILGILCVSTLPFHSLLSKQDMASHAETTIVNEVRDQIYPTEKSAQVSDSILTESTENAVSDWNLILVNPWNYLPDDFSVELTELKNGHAIDQRAYPDLQDMMDAAREEGLAPLICSSYRTYEKQETLYNNRINKYLAEGYSMEKAITEAGKWVAVPGTSEHQTGLAVDIVTTSYQTLDEKQENTAEQKWLMENSYKYGFILRYPNDKSEITGIYYEPWHYRYVGKEVAKEIYEKGICLEEYLDSLAEE